VTEALQNAGFVFDPADKAAIGSRNENRYTIYQLPYAEIGAAQVLRPTIKIEMTYATLRLPRVILPVSSFVSEAFGRPPDVAAVPCVSMAETAAEKLGTAMDLAGLSRDADPALVRHIYDLHMMRDLVDLARVTALAGDIAARPMQPNLSTSIRPMPPIAQAKPATPSMRSAPIRSTACAIRTSSRRWSMASERNSMRR
jgi:hypothetical protein